MRRYNQSTAFGGTTTYLHDQKDVAQSNTTPDSNPLNNYLAMPGTGEVLAFSSTTGGTTSTYVPLQDLMGSTVGLVNSANSLQTEYTYDPFGNVTTIGQASSYPYLCHSMEYDRTGLYFTGSVYYSPALGRPLQGVDPLGNPGGGGGTGTTSFLPSADSGQGGLDGLAGTVANNAANLGISAAAGLGAAGLVTLANEVSIAAGPVGWVVAGVTDAVLGILDLFGFDLFGGGGGTPYIPPGYRRIPHYPAGQFIGVGLALLPAQKESDKYESPTGGRIFFVSDNDQYTRGLNTGKPSSEGRTGTPKLPIGAPTPTPTVFGCFVGKMGREPGGMLACIIGVGVCYAAPNRYSCGPAVIGCLDWFGQFAGCYKDPNQTP